MTSRPLCQFSGAPACCTATCQAPSLLRLYSVVPSGRSAVTPEDERQTNESREQVRAVLGGLPHRQAALLVLRSDGLSYSEIAAALNLNPTSIGTLLTRAEAAFQKEFIGRYGME